MEKYEIIFKRSVKKDLLKIPKKDVRKILKKIDLLADNPLPAQSEKLSGQQRYRLRQGNYLILYNIEKNKLIVTVVRVGHRPYVYKT